MPTGFRTVFATICGALVLAGCGPHLSPREAEEAERGIPSGTSPVPRNYQIDTANAFPGVALEVSPPAGTPGVDAAETAAANAPNSAAAAMDVGYAYYIEAA